MQLPDWVPEGVEVTVPNAARMYDYALGGYHNFAVDREFVERVEKLLPGAIAAGYANRAFVGRSVRWLVNAGIRQFLDIGSGIPTLGNVHEIAQRTAPEARVMYVDIDPVAVAHSKALLAGNPWARAIQADLRTPADILYHPDVLALFDFAQPLAVLLNAVLHFVPDADDPTGLIAQICEPLVADSYLAITHGTPITHRIAEQGGVRDLYERTPTRLHLRTKEQVAALLTGLELVEPGLVGLGEWHPDPAEADSSPHLDAGDADNSPQRWIVGAVARKP